MKVAVISGSHRKLSSSLKAAEWIASRMTGCNLEPVIIDLADVKLPFWNDGFWQDESPEKKAWKPFSERLKACGGVVLISPEWGGMVPPKLTNFLLSSSGEFAFKPTLLVSVSEGPSGTYPIASLRMSAAKNNQMIYLPDHLILRQAGEFFTGPHLNPEHPSNRRLDFNLDVLARLMKALSVVRSEIEVRRYPYGM